MEDYSHSSGDTPTSGISSAVSTGEWDTVLNSIQKISGDLQEVWSHLGPRPKPLSYLSHTSKRIAFYLVNCFLPFSVGVKRLFIMYILLTCLGSVWMPSPSFHSDRVPLHWSFSGSTAERTQALRLWLQQNKIQHSKPFPWKPNISLTIDIYWPMTSWFVAYWYHTPYYEFQIEINGLSEFSELYLPSVKSY